MAEEDSEKEFAFAPATRTGLIGVTTCPEEAWHRCFSFLFSHEVVRAALAFLSNQAGRESIGSAWDAQVVLGCSWPKGTKGLRPFLAAARATYLSESTFLLFQGCLDSEQQKKSRISAESRSIALSSAPSALAFSGGNTSGEGLLAISSGREVRLIGRDDMKSCGTLGLALPKGCREVATMAFSSDSSTLAVVPMSESGSPMPEIQFYTTEEKSKPIVTKMRNGDISGIDFLRLLNDTGDLVATSGCQLSQISPSTGGIVKSWKQEPDGCPIAFNACRAISHYEVATIADKLVAIWDLRTDDGLACSVKATVGMTALHASSFSSSSTAFLGDVHGSLHRVDWRRSGLSPLEPLWTPPTERESAAPCQKILAERGCICLLSGTSMTMLATDPCVVELGCASIRSRLSSVASAPGVWAFGIDSSGRSSQYTVAVVDSNGHSIYHHMQKELSDATAKKSEKLKQQKEQKKEKQGKKPSCGKAAHGRNSGR